MGKKPAGMTTAYGQKGLQRWQHHFCAVLYLCMHCCIEFCLTRPPRTAKSRVQVQLSYVASGHIVHSAAMHVGKNLSCCLQSCSIQEGKVGHYHDRVYTVKHRCVDVPHLLAVSREHLTRRSHSMRLHKGMHLRNKTCWLTSGCYLKRKRASATSQTR